MSNSDFAERLIKDGKDNDTLWRAGTLISKLNDESIKFASELNCLKKSVRIKLERLRLFLYESDKTDKFIHDFEEFMDIVEKDLIKLNAINSSFPAASLPLFLIRRPEDDIYPQVDAHHGFLVAASCDQEAREFVKDITYGDEPKDIWLNPKKTTCTMVAPVSKYTENSVVIKDFNAG
tara:strand:+ start:123 stop:656 length:534 start_codon:yes stop_codon:yes gene_type:complete